jgi:cell pole-organizing protein PopZ
MEEILASIRRIISEEDKPADSSSDVLELQPPPAPVAEMKAPITAPAPRPAPAPIPEPPKPAPVAAAPPPPAPEPKIAVFEEPEEPAPPQRPLDEELMIVERDEPAPIPAVPPPAAPRPAPQAEWTPPAQSGRTLVSDPVASQTSNALGRLMGSMMVNSGNTLDDVVRELLKPLLKDWLDANLPQLVEAEVAKEIDRIRRMSR